MQAALQQQPGMNSHGNSLLRPTKKRSIKSAATILLSDSLRLIKENVPSNENIASVNDGLIGYTPGSNTLTSVISEPKKWPSSVDGTWIVIFCFCTSYHYCWRK